jgi:hypothetical protein
VTADALGAALRNAALFPPDRKGHVGGHAADNRLFVDAVLYRYRTGVPWRGLDALIGDKA